MDEKHAEAEQHDAAPHSDAEQHLTGATSFMPEERASRTGIGNRSEFGEGNISAFISYSRHDYYFAEALQRAISSKKDVDAWMDVRELRLGSDWATLIDEAIDTADVVLLVGSPAAAKSTYVMQECQRAIYRGIPIVLAVAAGASTRLDVPVTSVHDLRSDLDSGVDELYNGIKASVKEPQPFRKPERLHRLYRPPRVILLLLACMIVELTAITLSLASALASISTPIEPELRTESELLGTFLIAFSGIASFGPVVMTAVGTLVSLTSIRAILRHELRGPAFISQRLVLFAIFAFATMLNRTMQERQVLSQISLPAVVQFMLAAPLFFLFIVLIAEVAAIAMVLRSQTLLIYTKPGYAAGISSGRSSQLDRDMLSSGLVDASARDPKRVTKAAEQAVVDAVPSGRGIHTYSLIYEDEDSGTADYVRLGCRSVGLHEQSYGYWTICIVSNFSRPDAVDRLAEEHSNTLIVVLATPTTIPDDSTSLRRLQWLDFRRHDPAALGSLIHALTGDGSTANSLPVPVSPRSFRVPASVSIAINHPLIAFGACLAIAGGIGLSTDVQAHTKVVGALALVFAVLCLRIVRTVGSRSYNKKLYRRDLGLWIFGVIAAAIASCIYFAPSGFFVVAYLLTFAVFAMIIITNRAGLAKSWLINEPVARQSFSLGAVVDFGPAIAVISALMFAVILSAGVAPKPDLYWSNGVNLGGLYPNTALPPALTLDNHNFLSDMHWSSPSQESVSATGLLNQDDCNPNCAEGKYRATPVRIVASDPAVCIVDVHPPYTSDQDFSTRINIFRFISVLDPDGHPTEYDVGAVNSVQSSTSLQCPPE